MKVNHIYTTETKCASLPLEEMFKKYYDPERFLSYCKECPSYGRVWSCPPGVPVTSEYLKEYKTMHLVAVKVIYDDEIIKTAQMLQPEELDKLMDASYGKVKRAIRETLLAIRNKTAPSVAIAAGECQICKICSRVENKACRFPDRLLYSFSAMGFDLSRVSTDILGIPILWENKGLPKYIVALAALVTN